MDNNSGGSPVVAGQNLQIDPAVFGLGGTTTKQDSAPQSSGGLTPNDGGEQNTQPNEAGELNVPSTESTQEEAQKPEDGKIFKKQAEDNRKMVIDMLEDKFQQLSTGKIKDSDLKQWFSSHSELAETANRSKRVKDRYRELMEKPLEVLPSDETILDEEEKPITPKELARILEEHGAEQEARILSKTLIQDREKTFESFAVSKRVVDQDVDVLKRNAEALYKVNPEWDYQDALAAAYHTITPSKGKPVNIAPSSTPAPDLNQIKIDATAPGGVQLISFEEFSGQRKK